MKRLLFLLLVCSALMSFGQSKNVRNFTKLPPAEDDSFPALNSGEKLVTLQDMVNYIDSVLADVSLYTHNGTIPADTTRIGILGADGSLIFADTTGYNYYCQGKYFMLPNPGIGGYTLYAMDGIKQYKAYIGNAGLELFDATHGAQIVANSVLLANTQTFDFNTNNSTGFYAKHQLGTQTQESAWFYDGQGDGQFIQIGLNYTGADVGFRLKPYDVGLGYRFRGAHTFRIDDTLTNTILDIEGNGDVTWDLGNSNNMTFTDIPADNTVTSVVGLTGSNMIRETSIDEAFPRRLNTTQRDALTPSAGTTIYCTDCTATDASTGVVQTYNGSTWKNHW